MRRGFAAVLIALAVAGIGANSSSAKRSDAWLTTRTAAQQDLRDRFRNIRTVACAPDRSSATQVVGNYRYWQRFWCSGATYDRISFRLRFRVTGRCGQCWTITDLTGTGARLLRTKAAATTQSQSPGTGSGPCGEDYYRNVDGHCVHRPSS